MSRERLNDQVSVKLDRELRAAVERVAQAEHRTTSAQIRHFVASAIEDAVAQRQAKEQAA
jgi:predicted transcriptional regulator